LFKFDSKYRYQFKKVEELVLSLLVKDEFDNQQPLQLIEASVGKEALGVILAPDGSIQDQF